ncbi:MAG: hypothetical protein AB1938_29610 [Myxococcota bacterium]
MKMYLPPPGGRDSRRGFLKKGLFGGLLLAVGGGAWLALKGSAEVALPTGLKVLDARRYAVVLALVDRFIPERPGFPSAKALDTARAVDTILTLVDDSSRVELNQLLMLFENALGNFLFGLRTTPFTRMSALEQQQVLDEWMTSRLSLRRTGYLALRTIVMSAYYGNALTWPATKYPGPPPGIHDPAAPVWKGGGEPRPLGNGVMLEQEAAPAPVDGGTP